MSGCIADTVWRNSSFFGVAGWKQGIFSSKAISFTGGAVNFLDLPVGLSG
jgi:hypothetical protein